jgi:thiol-disulfide isomerase/thioredoxin
MNYPQSKSIKKHLKWIGQALIFISLFIGLSTFLARNMLDTEHTMPNLSNDSNATLLINSQNLLPTKQIKDWQQAPQHLVYFFAPWCAVCALSQPSLEAFSQLKPNTQIVMVALDWESPQAVEDFKQNHQFDLPILLGNQALKQQWKIDAYPSYYFLDSEGKILSKDRGLVTLPGLLARSI